MAPATTGRGPPRLVDVFVHADICSCPYSYLYARMMAACIWQQFFQPDPFAVAAGRRFRDRFLAPGCSRAPVDIVSHLLDGVAGPTVDAFVRHELEQ